MVTPLSMKTNSVTMAIHKMVMGALRPANMKKILAMEFPVPKATRVMVRVLVNHRQMALHVMMAILPPQAMSIATEFVLALLFLVHKVKSLMKTVYAYANKA